MTAHVEEKPLTKTVIREVIEAQPDDASYEEIMRELAFERMVDRGLANVRAGESVTHDEAMRRIRSWRN
jgi:predicted transcriptional regulator